MESKGAKTSINNEQTDFRDCDNNDCERFGDCDNFVVKCEYENN